MPGHAVDPANPYLVPAGGGLRSRSLEQIVEQGKRPGARVARWLLCAMMIPVAAPLALIVLLFRSIRGEKGEWIAMSVAASGALLIELGVFVPVFQLPVVGGSSLFDFMRVDAIILLTAAGSAVVLALLQSYVALRVVAAVAIGDLAFRLLQFRSLALRAIGDGRSARAELGIPADAPLEDATWWSFIGWGMIFPIAGTLLILLAATRTQVKSRRVK